MSQTIKIDSVSKSFGGKYAINDISLNIAEGEMVALIGPSGSGKSTLLRLIAGMEITDKKSDSSICILDQSMQKNGRFSSGIRKIRTHVGVIFQQFNLISRLNVMRNVLVGALGSVPIWRGTLGIFTEEEKKQAFEALERVGLAELAYQRASTLSGGQQQRVAIARTLMQQASVILADEPIASLDPKSAKTVMKTLKKLRKVDGKTVLVTLHHVEYARKYCQRVIALVEGKIVFDGKSKHLTDEVLEELYGTSMSDIDDDDIETDNVEPINVSNVLLSGASI